MPSSYNKEFPCLAPLGLYAADIKGDGNCLFNALSDQLFGTQAKHFDLRQRTIEFMRNHKDYYAVFMHVLPGGATRRQPKRKNAGGYSSSFDYNNPTPEDINKAFDDHLNRMAKGGTYGDNMEISAFSSCYEVNVHIFQREHSYMVQGEGKKADRETLYIAYHTWEHYSSIRNLNGPHQGQPAVVMKTLTPEMQLQQEENLKAAPTVLPGQVKALMSSVYFPITESQATKALEKHHGDLNYAADALMSEFGDTEESPAPSSVQSSSVERDLASDEDFAPGPKKKQDRRMSRASKSAQRKQRERKHQEIASRLDSASESLESLVNVNPNPVRRRHRAIVADDSDDENMSSPPALDDGSTSPNSDYSVPTDYSSQSQTETTKPATKITIRLSKPSDSASASNGVNKNGHSQKRPIPIQDMRDIKKQAQKTAAKERRKQAANPNKSASSSFSTQQPTPPVMTSGFRILHI